jgi:caspase domain-containing protein
LANWAVAVGINAYDSRTLQLSGAVDDAMAMCRWLLSPAGGNVPRHNLVALLHPAPSSLRITIGGDEGRAGVEHTLVVRDPTRDGLINALVEVERQSRSDADPCDRFYFHFSGHGVMSQEGFAGPQSGLLLRDFSEALTDKSLALEDLKDFFAASRFADQFYFLDGCRNLPLNPRFRLGRFPRYPDAREPSWPVVQQFVMLATAPGYKAAELPLPVPDGHGGRELDERGAFTSKLLEGLEGAGIAKELDEDRNPSAFVIRWEKLFQYVKQSVESLPLPFVQPVQQDGARGAPGRTPNPELGSKDPALLPDQVLTVDMRPSDAASFATLSIYNGYTEPPLVRQLGSVPIALKLPPRRYALKASASGFRPSQPSWPVTLYDDKAITLDLQRLVDSSTVAEMRAPAREVPTPPFIFTTVAQGIAISRAEVRIGTDDPLSSIELSGGGRSIEVGRGQLSRSELTPGLYEVRLSTPEGQVVVHALDLAPGSTSTAEITGTPREVSPTLLDVIGQRGFYRHPSGALEVSEQVGPIADPDLSTVLTLAAAISTFGGRDIGWGARLRGIELDGVSLPPSARSGAYLVLGDELRGEGAISWDAVDLHIRQAAEEVRHEGLRVAGTTDACATITAPLSPGAFDLEISAPGWRPTVFPLIALRDHWTLLVLIRRQDGGVHVFQHMPRLRPTIVAGGPGFDPLETRRLEIAERHLLYGRYSSIESPESLARLEWSNPLARCLAAYLFLRNGELTRARALAQDLASESIAWADPHVILCEILAGVDPAGALEEMHRALNSGLPTFVGGLSLLRGAVARARFQPDEESAFARAIRHRVPGLIWTAYESAVR